MTEAAEWHKAISAFILGGWCVFWASWQFFRGDKPWKRKAGWTGLALFCLVAAVDLVLTAVRWVT